MSSSFYHGYKVPSSTYTNAFIERSWKLQGEMERLELLGLYCTVIVNLNSVIESYISDTLKYMVGMASFHTDYSSQKYENKMLSTSLNINESVKNQLNNATYKKLEDLTKSVTGESYNGILGDLSKDYQAINKMRNIIAHGRRFEMRFDGPKVTYDNTQLKGVTSRLTEKGIISCEDERSFESILNEDVVSYFHKCGHEIMETYWTITNGSDTQKIQDIKKKLMPRLPNIMR